VRQDVVTMSEKQVQSILNWRAPRSVKDVQIFIGFTNFYPHFIENFQKSGNQLLTRSKPREENIYGFGGKNRTKVLRNLCEDIPQPLS